MSLSTAGIDVYQLTTLLAHAQLGRLEQQVGMSFFFRKMPRFRNYVVTAGLRSILQHCSLMRFDDSELALMKRHPVVASVFAQKNGQQVLAQLANLKGFIGRIWALPEGTPAFAGPAYRTDGTPILMDGIPLTAYTPLVQVCTDMVRAKLIETPWLSRLNYMSMIASKAARVVSAARSDGVQRTVLEFGQRRTHQTAAVDGAYAAYLAGCDATSNLAATLVHGIPSTGTMDHFAIQASEEAGISRQQTETQFFRTFVQMFPHASTLLVDTYDTMKGIEGAVQASCKGIRIDSNVTTTTVRQARQLLNQLGAEQVKIFVSDGLDEHRVQELAATGCVDGFGVGENILCSPDAATGIGAVGKLVVNGYDQPTMKISKGSGKATLPGLMQVYRYPDYDLVAGMEEAAPSGGVPLLEEVWNHSGICLQPTIAESRMRTQQQLAALPRKALSITESYQRTLVLSDALLALVQRLS